MMIKGRSKPACLPSYLVNSSSDPQFGATAQWCSGAKPTTKPLLHYPAPGPLKSISRERERGRDKGGVVRKISAESKKHTKANKKGLMSSSSSGQKKKRKTEKASFLMFANACFWMIASDPFQRQQRQTKSKKKTDSRSHYSLTLLSHRANFS